MAERYQERPYLGADYDRGDPHGAGRGESDPLAELARLIGQTDPAAAGRQAPHPLQSRANIRPQYSAPAPEQYDLPEETDSAPPSPPSWMQRGRQEPAPRRHCRRTTTTSRNISRRRCIPCIVTARQQPHAHEPSRTITSSRNMPTPSRRRTRRVTTTRSTAGSNPAIRIISAIRPIRTILTPIRTRLRGEEPAPKKRSSGLMTVAAVLALAVVGTGAAFAYRTFVGSPRSGEPPIIRADNSPTKVVPAQSDGAFKTPDRMPPGDGGEKLVSREETPVDVNSRSGAPRVVFPPLNQNSNPPPVASVSPTGAALATAANGTMPNNEPRRIKTLAVKGDAAENGGIPAGATAPPPRTGPATRSVAAPAAAPARATLPRPMPARIRRYRCRRRAASRPIPRRPASRRPIRSRRPTGAAIWSRFPRRRTRPTRRPPSGRCRANFPNVLGSRSPVIKRADLGEKGVYYRAMVGPFGSPDEASQFCGSLKTAGGQCVVQRN